MYFGEAHTTLDESGRLVTPVQFRQLMKAHDHDVWYITRGFDRFLFLFHKEEWDRLLKNQIPAATLNPRILDFRRFLLGGAAKAKLDGQHRLLIPQHLRAYAGIDRESVLLGLEDHLEMWSEQGWNAFQDEKLSEYRRMAAELFGPPDTLPEKPMEDTDDADS